MIIPKSLALSAPVIAITGRMWSFIAGIINTILIVSLTSPVEQGYYYTITAIAGSQIVFEMGINYVLMQKISHHKKDCNIINGAILIEQTAKIELLRIIKSTLTIALISGLSYLIIVGQVGNYILKSKGELSEIEWSTAWGFLVISNTILFVCTPFISIIEGLGNVLYVNLVRVSATIISSMIAWILIINDHALWSPAVFPLILLALQALAVKIKIKHPFESIFYENTGRPKENWNAWKDKIYPMQIRISISWIFGYLIYQCATPLIFHFQGPESAGKFGISMAIFMAITGATTAWTSTKLPEYGHLFSLNKFNELNSNFRMLLSRTTVFCLLLSLCASVAIYILIYIEPNFDNKFPSIGSLIFIFASASMQHITSTMAGYLRVSMREPLMLMTVTSGLTNITILVILLDRNIQSAPYISLFCTMTIAVLWTQFIYKNNKYKN